MENAPRIFDSEIIVTENSHWMFRGNEITLESVLNYFKENLSEDDSGIFITNTYGNLTEKGYITCFGFPLKLIRWEEEQGQLYLIGDNLLKMSLDELDFYADLDQKLFVKRKGDQFLKYSLNRDTHSKLSQYLEEEGEDFYIQYGNLKKKVFL
jgi:hypothetical protein